jgi:3-oxoacyl-[acyl-carrier protein] reductase
MKLSDRVCIVTGGGRGIGRAYALRMAQAGARLVIADINEANGQAVANELQKEGAGALAIRTDVSDEQSTRDMARAAMDKFGRIDVLVNNAALFAELTLKPFTEISVEEWDGLMAVNVKGVWLCAKAVAPFMKEQKSGRIINISSGVWLSGRANYMHYVASKAAVVGITRALARELGRWNINTNCVAPGAVLTEIPRETSNPEHMAAIARAQCIRRTEVPGDLVGTILFLASDDSSFITGQTINVDGGTSFQ